MTVKEFFKGNVFKCLVTLLCVLLVSGVFLTIMNGLLAVSPEEKFQRDMQKIYGKSVKLREVDVADYNDSAKILEAYYVLDDGNYLVKSKGLGGFDNGTVTCWVVVGVNKKTNTISGIEKVVKSEHDSSQTYISNINDNFYQGFYGKYENGYIFNPNEGFIKTGATRSATAICNSVNGAIDYVNGKFLGNVAVDIYADFELTDYIETKQSSHEIDENGNIVYTVVTKGHTMPTGFTVEITVNAEGLVTAYSIVNNGSTSDNYVNRMLPEILDGTLFVGKDFAGIQAIINDGISYPGDNKGTTISTGATQSNYLCVYAAAFATKNYEKCLETQNEEGGNE